MPPINDFCDGRFGEGAMAVGEFGRHGRIFFGGVYCRGAIWLVIRTSVGKPRGLLWGMVSLGDWDEIDRISVFTLLSALRADSVLVLPPVLSCPKRDPACGQPCVLRLIRLEKSVLSRVQYCDYLDVRAGRMEGFRPGRGTACGEGNLAFRRFPESWHAGGFQVYRPALPLPALLLPVGLSFYVFQTTSYLLDLYHGKIRPERNLLTYGAYAAFFPTLISGPIQKSWRTLPLFQKRRRLSYADWQGALFTFLYGGFLKLVIADRLARFTDPVFAGFGSCSSVVLLLAVPAYAVQIYADFAGYSDMAIAVAGLLGFSLHSNFERPYLALTIVDFWRRWHISLTDWFREYLYFPLGGSRKGKVRTYCNVAIVFLVSGLWHGAQWHYVFWGGLHAFYQIFGRLTLPARERFRRKAGIRSESGIYRIWQRLCVFFLTSFAWIFFRNGFDDACSFLACLWKNRKLPALSGDGGLLTLFPAAEIAISFAAAALLLVVSSVRETGRDIRWLTGRKTAVRFACGLLLLTAVAVFGLYGPGYSGSAFIYAGF